MNTCKLSLKTLGPDCTTIGFRFRHDDPSNTLTSFLHPGEDFYTDVGYLEAATNVYSGMAKLESGNFLTEYSQGILKGEVSLYHLPPV